MRQVNIMDFEHRLKAELKREGEGMSPPKHVKARVYSAIQKDKIMSRKIKWFKSLIISVLIACVLVPIGVFADKTMIPELVEKIIGTREEAQQNWHVTSEGYEQRIQEMQVVEKYLTEAEFNDYVRLESERIKIYEAKKQAGFSTLEAIMNMSEEEQNKLDQIDQKLSAYWDEIIPHFTYTKEEVQALMGFPLHSPAYLPKGYEVEEEDIDHDITLNHPKPIVRTKFMNGEFGFSVYQSELLKGNRDPFEWNFDTITPYKLAGNQLFYGEYNDSNVTGMKMLVPAKDGKPAHQIVIIDDIQSKQEIEKIMLSLLEEK